MKEAGEGNEGDAVERAKDEGERLDAGGAREGRRSVSGDGSMGPQQERLIYLIVSINHFENTPHLPTESAKYSKACFKK